MSILPLLAFAALVIFAVPDAAPEKRTECHRDNLLKALGDSRYSSRPQPSAALTSPFQEDHDNNPDSSDLSTNSDEYCYSSINDDVCFTIGFLLFLLPISKLLKYADSTTTTELPL